MRVRLEPFFVRSGLPLGAWRRPSARACCCCCCCLISSSGSRSELLPAARACLALSESRSRLRSRWAAASCSCSAALSSPSAALDRPGSSSYMRISATCACTFCRAAIASSICCCLASASCSLCCRRCRRMRTSRAPSSVSSSRAIFLRFSLSTCCRDISTCASRPCVATSASSSGMMTQEQYSQMKSETGMKGVTSISDWRIVPECMHTALQSSNWPEPASKNISCDLCSSSIMCWVLSNESFFSWKSCCAILSLACCRERVTLETPSSIVTAKRCIVSRSSACSWRPPIAETCAARLKEASFRMSTFFMSARVDCLRQTTCDGQRRRPSGRSGAVCSMKTSSTSPTTTAYRSVQLASAVLRTFIRAAVTMEPLAVLESTSFMSLRRRAEPSAEPRVDALRRDILDMCRPPPPPLPPCGASSSPKS
mmetsp:Transcript_48507/g.156147  ORF Transcript_48507/g.156147 Transcript_48507/m.156147 type:complete len:427 (-) Transcript_48507:3294-4574(-)